MKMLKKLRFVALVALGMFFFASIHRANAQPGLSVSFQLFYDQLAPYGEWIDDPQHGYIWLPDAGPDFKPYASNGYWVMTKYGNTWVSHYDWGWAPFHYGRWFYTDYYGWAWIPGYEWGPAWVSWRRGGGYYGWAPLGPSISLSLHMHIPARHWVFVQQRYITSHMLHRHYMPRTRYVNIYNRTTIINNTYVYNNHTYVSGPARKELERVTRSRVNVREVRHTNNPARTSVDNRVVSIYRPAIDESTRSSARPVRVTDAGARSSEAVRPVTRSENSRGTTTTRVERRSETVRPATEAAPRNEAARPATTRVERRSETVRPTTGAATRNEAARPATTRVERRSETVRPTTGAATRNEAARPVTRSENNRSTAASKNVRPSRNN